ncbi:nucleotidyltransferase domain-containing protein [Agriterribacter sp.]|uniref:nucleotidyltransferase domain-containing protein n=1 Tax=Agriterribacter sp. TaxID=2821509 RepID=UPI002BDFB816|nr:nucleotidyltransferase domain-containing protein [Agriterribacter sp.]HRO47032.1 nucleotidyltransferase domain-containing protein [Agriterribacter sp.]HRQ17816.1 nucleotidyltransferase domain-containing protein [Agriterribacter sp.]
MNSLGGTIRKFRKDEKLPLRTVAASLGIDQAVLSRIERGQRRLTREQVVKLAEYFKIKENDLLVAWLSDKLVYEVEDEDMALKALQVAEEKVNYITKPKVSKNSIIGAIRSVLKKDGRVTRAWLFGSYARGEEKLNSDIDIMIELNNKKKYSMFDILDISFLLENEINKKVDVVEKGYLKDFALQTATTDLIKIYG